MRAALRVDKKLINWQIQSRRDSEQNPTWGLSVKNQLTSIHKLEFLNFWKRSLQVNCRVCTHISHKRCSFSVKIRKILFPLTLCVDCYSRAFFVFVHLHFSFPTFLMWLGLKDKEKMKLKLPTTMQRPKPKVCQATQIISLIRSIPFNCKWFKTKILDLQLRAKKGQKLFLFLWETNSKLVPSQ